MYFFAFLVGSLLSAQSVTFSNQAGQISIKSAVGKQIKGLSILAVTICPENQLSIMNGLIFQQAVKEGFSPLSPSIGEAIINQKVALNFKTLAIEIVGDVTIAATEAGIGGSIKLSKSWLAALSAGHAFWDVFAPQLASSSPNPTALFAELLTPNGITTFNNACTEGTILNTVIKGQKQLAGPIQLEKR